MIGNETRRLRRWPMVFAVAVLAWVAGPSANDTQAGEPIAQGSADATVIGLQYAAQLLDADNLSRELQFIGRHSDKIALSILAGLWWLAIIRGVVGIAVGLGRFMRAATTITGQKRYG